MRVKLTFEPFITILDGVASAGVIATLGVPVMVLPSDAVMFVQSIVNVSELPSAKGVHGNGSVAIYSTQVRCCFGTVRSRV